MDVASLNLAVSSDSVKQANVELRAMAPAASAAERAAQKWGMTTSAAARSTEDFSKRVQRTIRDLEFERQQLTRNAAEQARYTALRRAGVTAASAEGRAISASVAALHAQRAARDAENKSLERRQMILARVNGAALALGAAIGGALAVRQFLTETIAMEKAQAQLAATLRSTGAIAGQSVESLNAHAAALQKVTAFGDDAVTAAQGLLLTFTNIRGDVFPQATEAVLNVATAMNTDLKSASIQVGKALNDPIAGVTALARAGIQFTDAQKETIKSLVESGRLVEAQRLVLKELETQFGGSARAARETLGGALTSLGNAWGDLFEIGKTGSDFLRLAIEDLTAAISDPRFDTFVETVGTLLFGAFGLAARGVTVMISGIGQLVDGFIWLDDKVYKTANLIVGSFVAAYEDVKTVWANFPDIMAAAFVGAVNAAVRGINALITASAEGINEIVDLANKVNPFKQIPKVGTGAVIPEMDNPAAGRLGNAVAGRNAAVNAAMSRDYLGRSDQALMDAASTFYGGEAGRGKAPPFAAPESTGAKGGSSNPYAKAIESAREYVLSKRAEAAAVGLSVEAASRLKHEQDLLNKVTADGRMITEAQRAALQGLAQDMAASDAALATGKFMHDAKVRSEEFLASQQVERDSIFLSTEAAAKLRYENEMLNLAKQQGAALTAEQTRAISDYAGQMASAEAQTRGLREAFDFAKDTATGFFKDLRQGLQEGQSIWDAFANAGINALNKIADKLFEMAIDAVITQMRGGLLGGGMGGGGGFLGSLIGGLFANGAAFQNGSVIPFARGAAFLHGSALYSAEQRFAAGGAIVNRPTTFPMAGDRRGLMGEAGPEAIMPLHRGSDGGLGVRMTGRRGGGGEAGQQPVVVHVYANEGFVRAEAEGAAVRVVNNATPGIVKESVKKSGEQVPGVMARHENERGGEWR